MSKQDLLEIELIALIYKSLKLSFNVKNESVDSLLV